MTRIRTCLAVAMVAVVAVLAVPTAASAQDDGDYPGTTATTAPAACTVTVAFSAPVVGGATINITVGCASILAGRTYTGIFESTPVVLPATVASANGSVTFANVRLPADLERNATHTVTLVDQATGATLGTTRVFIDANGRIATPPSSNIPRTGSDLVEPGLRIGGVLLAGGTVALLVARRRRSAALAA